MSRRRQLVLAAGLGPLVTPLGSLAQPPPPMRRIGHLSLSKSDNEVAQLGRAKFRESEVAPGLTRLALLFNPTSPGAQAFGAARSRSAIALGMTVQSFPATRPDDITAALERIAAGRAEMLLVANDGVTESRIRDITRSAIQHKIVSIGNATLFTSVGGAIYYGANLQEMLDRSASHVDRILRGARPADLPVEEPSKFDLIINLKTMRALGITVPQSVLRRADEVIE